MPPEYNLTSDSDRESILSLKEVIVKPRRNSTGPKYCCSIAGCNENFKRLDHLDRHEFHHTGIKKHACTYEGCDKEYTILTHLKRHLRSTHERTEAPEKNVSCIVKECGKMFPSLCNMQRHMREVHENPKVYTCVYCPEKFTQKLKMRRHEITKHTGEYPFNCEKCSKGFYQQWQYEKHTPSCKVYPCPNCSELFDKWTSYLKHCKEMQHGRKYYHCEYCARVYAKPGELQRHVMVKHVETDSVMSFKCTHEGCKRVYAYERNLRQHVKTAHAGKRFECQENGCQNCFSSAQNLAKHLKREHTKRKREDSSCSTNEVGAEPIQQVKTKRKKRKDAGTTVLSSLACLSGIAVERQFDKLLRLRESDALEAVSSELIKTFDEEQLVSDVESLLPKNLPKVTKKEINSILTKSSILAENVTDVSLKNSDEADLNDLLALVMQD